MYYGEKLWSDEDAREVHENTLNILEKLGIEVQEKQAREDLAKAGCTVAVSYTHLDVYKRQMQFAAQRSVRQKKICMR